MANGQFIALGSVQHLKTKYLDGYTLDVNCRSGTIDVDVDVVVAQVLHTALPGSQLVERHGRFLKFDLPRASATVGIGIMFQRLQDLKDNSESCVEDYSISQWCVIIKKSQVTHCIRSFANLLGIFMIYFLLAVHSSKSLLSSSRPRNRLLNMIDSSIDWRVSGYVVVYVLLKILKLTSIGG